jgi:hypothetical protein
MRVGRRCARLPAENKSLATPCRGTVRCRRGERLGSGMVEVRCGGGAEVRAAELGEVFP